MALMTWSNKYSVGVDELDNQHKAFMKALNDLQAAAMRGQANVVADPLIRQIVSIAHEHFKAEEKYMESIRFPGLAAHRAKHEELTVKFREMVSRHQKGDTTVYNQLLYFTRDWQTRHMQTEDQAYAAWIGLHPVQSSAR
jgi:hemerythrin